MPFRAQVRKAMLAVAGSSIVSMLCACPGGAQPREDPVITDVFEMGPRGGTFVSQARGNPVEGVSLELPPAALKTTIQLSLGYSRIRPRIRAGYASGVVLTLKAEPDPGFDQPLRINVRFKPDPKYKGVVGFRVHRDGGLQVIDLLHRDLESGKASFATFESLWLTWVYLN